MDPKRYTDNRSHKIHIINRLSDPSGGSELRATNLYRLLSPLAPTTLWVSKHYTPAATEQLPVRKLETLRASFPQSGTFIIVGVYFDLGKWIYLARPRRVALVYNTPDPDLLSARIDRYARAFKVFPELVFCSEMMKYQAGRPGIVLPSLLDLDRFKPSPRKPNAKFTVGRLSRSESIKHHPDDTRFYRLLTERGFQIRIMGPSQEMLNSAAQTADIELLPVMSVDAADFLGGLDCFFYRTSPKWEEPWGRVVIEAMASGLPVVAHHRGGYAQVIEHGVNGFLFDREEEAVEIIEDLRSNVEKRNQIGMRARLSAEAILSESEKQRIVGFYIGAA